MQQWPRAAVQFLDGGGRLVARPGDVKKNVLQLQCQCFLVIFSPPHKHCSVKFSVFFDSASNFELADSPLHAPMTPLSELLSVDLYLNSYPPTSKPRLYFESTVRKSQRYGRTRQINRWFLVLQEIVVLPSPNALFLLTHLAFLFLVHCGLLR